MKLVRALETPDLRPTKEDEIKFNELRLFIEQHLLLMRRTDRPIVIVGKMLSIDSPREIVTSLQFDNRLIADRIAKAFQRIGIGLKQIHNKDRDGASIPHTICLSEEDRYFIMESPHFRAFRAVEVHKAKSPPVSQPQSPTARFPISSPTIQPGAAHFSLVSHGAADRPAANLSSPTATAVSPRAERAASHPHASWNEDLKIFLRAHGIVAAGTEYSYIPSGKDPVIPGIPESIPAPVPVTMLIFPKEQARQVGDFFESKFGIKGIDAGSDFYISLHSDGVERVRRAAAEGKSRSGAASPRASGFGYPLAANEVDASSGDEKPASSPASPHAASTSRLR